MLKLDINPPHSKTIEMRKESHSMVFRMDTMLNPECSHFATAACVHCTYTYTRRFTLAWCTRRFSSIRIQSTALLYLWSACRRAINSEVPLTDIVVHAREQIIINLREETFLSMHETVLIAQLCNAQTILYICIWNVSKVWVRLH